MRRRHPAARVARDTERAPWDVLFLFGGGLALAEAITAPASAPGPAPGSAAPPRCRCRCSSVLVTLVVIVVTEFASNVAAAASFIPVVAGVTVASGPDPLVLTAGGDGGELGPVMPAGTPPNAIAYATGYVTVPHDPAPASGSTCSGCSVIPAVVAFAVAAFLWDDRGACSTSGCLDQLTCSAPLPGLRTIAAVTRPSGASSISTGGLNVVAPTTCAASASVAARSSTRKVCAR